MSNSLHTVATGFTCSGVAACVATVATHPIDVLKTRVQLGQAASYAGALQTASQGGFEGVRRLLTGGMTPALLRALAYGGARLGMYGPIDTALRAAVGRSKFDSSGSAVARKVFSGCISGSSAAWLCAPFELLKVRLQQVARLQDAKAPPQGAAAIAKEIVSERGFTGLWAGAGPAALRSALLTASQCVAYDEAKEMLRPFFEQSEPQPGAGESKLLQFSAGGIAGLVSTTVTSPADVVKTHMMASVSGKNSSSGQLPPQSGFQTARALVAAEGPTVLLKGWFATYVRLGPQTMITLFVLERLRALAGMRPGVS
eukprot:TRINITY_DN33765_c0_g1_i2.p1 TRINITY_DN33765_c0_g1~~TRINITY_DN33765_c0_g1_i2.p1  ORF type:complete len:314 (-),score=54.29 TRINITY_DN33765_c0_g1_i2:202-1143(-)